MFPIEALSTQFICLPVKNQLITKARFDYLKDFKLVDLNSTDEIEVLIGSIFIGQ